eukprot:TRINITY_DN568_c0_g1_i15.p2 TRINITY_DN568_c0_g1~~TRINITY_DN568_c0_g1_i15.p2  ORF type:complete len:292 (-),score=33.58 TRINITY_DN568_c0_g1_i15:83-958(-)
METKEGKYKNFIINQIYLFVIRCSCKDGYYRNPNIHSTIPCLQCNDHCANCQNNQSCSQCNQGYYLNTTTCEPCLEHCLLCSNKTICQKCDTSYYWNAQKQLCEKGSSSCKSGDYYDTQQDKCVSCSTNMAYCAKCQIKDYCTECLTGTKGTYITLSNGKCLVSCQAGAYPNPDTSSQSLCLSCMAHCIQCKSSTTCTDCGSQYTWNSKSNDCIKYCNIGEYFDQKTSQCESCQVQYCSDCQGSGMQCTECVKGYDLKVSSSNSNNNVCTKTAEIIFANILVLLFAFILLI